MRESERRIQQYQAQLPRVRERIIASLLIFAFSIVMMTMSAFAWVTLSVSPEVSGVTTTIAANGNLEIALADDDGAAPGATMIGDSNLTLAARNVTWGNFINLTDPSYGLDQIVLRPAMLNTSALATNPFYAAKYSADGRIESTHAMFEYTKYDATVNNFTKSDEKGVKAVSSGSYKNVSIVDPYQLKYIDMADDISSKKLTATSQFNALGTNANYKSSLQGLMGAYVDGVLNGNGDSVDCTKYVSDLYKMMLDLDVVMEMCGEIMIDIFDMYQLHTYNTLENYKYEDVDDFLASVKTDLATLNAKRTSDGKTTVSISSLDQYIKDRAMLRADIVSMKAYADIADSNSGKILWGEIKGIVGNMVDIPNCIMRNPSGYEAKVSNIGLSNATKYLGGTNSAIINGGLLYRMDARVHTGTGIIMKDIQVTAKISFISQKVKANVYTSAPDKYPTSTLEQDRLTALDATGIASLKRDFIAEDTYGLSIDFWLRTNAPGIYLTLEGDVITETYDIEKEITVITDEENNITEQRVVKIYIADIYYSEDADAEAFSQEVYSLDEEPTLSSEWYYVENDYSVSENGGTIKEMPEKKTGERVIGYTGVNRIWEELDPQSPDYISYSTSQGSGSCYTFYPNTPEELNLTLDVLSAFRLAFVDQEGNLLSEARLATESYCQQYGQVIVPIVLDSNNSIDLGTDIDGKQIRAITALEKNTPTFITVLMYLDASQLSNDKVLSSSDIDGQINLQFGSSETPKPIEDEDLMNKQIRISATADDTLFNDDDADTIAHIELNITGDTPKTVTANFIREINSMQGSRQEEISFTGNGSVWSCDYEFLSPGTYILRSVRIDGVERILEVPLRIVVEGFQVDSFTGTKGSSSVIMTANKVTDSETFTLKISKGGEKFDYPKTAKAIFINEKNNAVTLNFSPNGTDLTTWHATCSFTTSGTYTLSNVILDDEYYPVSTITRKVYVGLEAQIYLYAEDEFTAAENHRITAKGHNYVYVGNEHEFSVQVEIFDDSGTELTTLPMLDLYYTGMVGVDGTENAPDAQLKWDADVGRYSNAQFVIKTPGIYEFERIIVDGNVIDKATAAPDITAVAADPVQYIKTDVPTNEYYTFAVDGTPTMVVYFKYAEAATVYGKFMHTDEDGVQTAHIIRAPKGELVDENGETLVKFIFALPSSEGVWNLDEIKMTNVCDDSKNFMSGEELVPLQGQVNLNGAFDKAGPDTDYYAIKVLDDETPITVYENVYVSNVDYTTSYTGTFMASQTLSVQNLTLVTYDGIALNTINDSFVKNYLAQNNLITFSWTYQKRNFEDQKKMMQEYGGYVPNSNVTVDHSVWPTYNATNGTFSVSQSQSMHAGLYDISIIVDGATAKIADKCMVNGQLLTGTTLPMVTVRTEKPTAVITAISPTGSNPTKITYTTKSLSFGRGTEPTFTATGNQTSSYTDYTATIYAVATADNSTQRHGSFTKPTLTITVAGIDSTWTASMVLPGGSADALTLSRTGNGTIKATLGKVSQIKSWTSNWVLKHSLDAYYGHGTQTITTMTVTKEGVSYTVTLDNPIVINNLSSVNQ